MCVAESVPASEDYKLVCTAATSAVTATGLAGCPQVAPFSPPDPFNLVSSMPMDC